MENKKVFVAFDLDDTLYKEIDFLRSGYRKIAEYIEAKTSLTLVYEKMIQDYLEGKDVFGALIDLTSGIVSKEILLDIYRNHIPDISLNADAKVCLEQLHSKGIPMGIITDGRSKTQRNKILALGLDQWIPESNWIISEEIDAEKPNKKGYLILEQRYLDYRYYYVGNNPKKDFRGANELGWTTICLLDSGEEIHPQSFALEDICLSQFKIKQLQDILELI